jgi:hypothetical protein
MHPPHVTRQKHYYFYVSRTHFYYRLSKPQGLVRPEGLGKFKKITSSVIEPVTFSALTTTLPRRPPLWSIGQSSWLQIQTSGFDSRLYQVFWEVVGLERGPLSLVSTIEELLVRKLSGSGLESREYGHTDPFRWPRSTLYPQKLALTSPTSGGRSVGTVRSRIQTTEFSLIGPIQFIFGMLELVCLRWHSNIPFKLQLLYRRTNPKHNYSAIRILLISLLRKVALLGSNLFNDLNLFS